MSDISIQTWQEWIQYLSREFGIVLSEAAVSKFKTFLTEIEIWNNKFNLVSYENPREILWRHFADSLAGLNIINNYIGSRSLGEIILIADIGTGAGFPGIPIKILKPQSNLFLIESIKKKCVFLENVIQKLGFSNTHIINDRAENMGRLKENRNKHDIVLSRAVTKLSPNLETAFPLLKIGGLALIYKTERTSLDKEELQNSGAALKVLGGRLSETFYYQIPARANRYCIMVFEKISDTLAQFPRRPGIIEKRPL